MDIADTATGYEERDREAALASRDRGPVILATGACLCCEEPLPDARRWCDAECRDTYLLHIRSR